MNEPDLCGMHEYRTDHGGEARPVAVTVILLVAALAYWYLCARIGETGIHAAWDGLRARLGL